MPPSYSALVLVFPNSSAADSYENGIQTYYAGNYNKALEILEPLAEQGDANTQFRVGLMYGWGLGIEQSAFEAYKWNGLVSVHLNSERTFWDKVAEWFTEIYLDFKLSSDQKKEADEWVKNWKPKYSK